MGINIKKLNEEHRGRHVLYKQFKGCDYTLIEEGVITGWNDRCIFVRYKNDIISKATYPQDLEFSIGDY